MSLQVQFLTLYLMAGSGVMLGIGFDVIEVFAREFKLRRWSTALMDIGYWLVATLFVFQVLVYANDGQVRMFIFLGLFLGVIIYFYLLSRIVRITVNGLLTFFLRLLRGISRILYRLIIQPIIYVYRLMQIVFGFLLTISIFLGKFMIQCLRYVSKMIVSWFKP